MQSRRYISLCPILDHQESQIWRLKILAQFCGKFARFWIKIWKRSRCDLHIFQYSYISIALTLLHFFDHRFNFHISEIRFICCDYWHHWQFPSFAGIPCCVSILREMNFAYSPFAILDHHSKLMKSFDHWCSETTSWRWVKNQQVREDWASRWVRVWFLRICSERQFTWLQKELSQSWSRVAQW
jgi:hypothetical protein